MDLSTRQNLFELIVQNIGIIIDIDGENTVRAVKIFFLHDDNAHLIERASFKIALKYPGP